MRLARGWLVLSIVAPWATPAAEPPTIDRMQAARERLAEARAADPADPARLADACDALAQALAEVRALDEAEGLAREAFATRRRLYGDEHPEVARSLHQIGALAGLRMDKPEAFRLHAEALALRRRALGPEHADVAESLARVARAYVDLSEWGLAERTLREALAMQRRLFGADDPRVLGSLLSLGDVLRWQNEVEEAEEILRDLVSIQRRRTGASSALAGSLEALAMLHRSKGEHLAAHALLLETVALRRATLGETHPGTLVGRANLAVNLAYLGRFAEADRAFAELRAVVASVPPGTDLSAIATLLDGYMGAAAEEAEDWAKAESFYRASLAAMERKGHAAETGESLRKLGQVRAARGDLQGAERLFERSADVYERARRKMTPGSKTATFKKTPYEQLALGRLENGKPAEAWVAVESARARVLADLLVARKTRGSASLAHAPFPLARIQAALRPEAAIVGWLDFELYRKSIRSWAYVIRKHGPVRWVRLPAESDLVSLSGALRAFRDGLGDGAASALGATGEAYRPAARAFWEKRFRLLEPLLGEVSELVLVPSWAMGGFPVDVLAGSDGRFVGDRFSIAYAPSATIYAWLRETGGAATEARTGLFVGDPPFRRDEAGPEGASVASATLRGALRDALRGDVREIGALPKLAWSRDEITRVAGLLPASTVLLGKDASEPALASLARSGAISRFDVVHIATHALIDDETPQRSGLVLSQLDVAEPRVPGRRTESSPGRRSSSPGRSTPSS